MPGPVSRTPNRTARHGPAPTTVMGATRGVIAKALLMRLDSALCSSVGTPAISPSAQLFGWRKFQQCGRAWLCVSNADSPRAFVLAALHQPCTGVHSVMPGNGATFQPG